MSIAITTPTGNVGRRVVERLLAAGEDLVLLARDPARLPEAVRARTRVVQGELEDPAALAALTRGARALLLVVPPHLGTHDWAGWQRAVGQAAADAARAAGVQRAVLLSSAGAQRDDLLAVSRLGEIERLLAAAVPHTVALRAGFFLENFLAAVPGIAAAGAIHMSLPPDRPHGMVATQDIGDVAARWLADASWVGHHVRGVHGAADVTPADVAAATTAALGRTVRYVQVPAAAMRDALLAAGATPHVADEYPRLMDGLATLPYRAEPRTAESTTPTTLDAWVRAVLAPAVAAAAAAHDLAAAGAAGGAHQAYSAR